MYCTINFLTASFRAHVNIVSLLIYWLTYLLTYKRLPILQPLSDAFDVSFSARHFSLPGFFYYKFIRSFHSIHNVVDRGVLCDVRGTCGPSCTPRSTHYLLTTPIWKRSMPMPLLFGCFSVHVYRVSKTGLLLFLQYLCLRDVQVHCPIEF